MLEGYLTINTVNRMEPVFGQRTHITGTDGEREVNTLGFSYTFSHIFHTEAVQKTFHMISLGIISK